jgi:hypothetical protein
LITVYEILEELRNTQDKRQVLLKHNSYMLQSILFHTFSPGVKFITNKFPPNYIIPDSPPEMGWVTLETEIRKIYLWVEGHPKVPTGLTYERKMELLLQFLESMEHKEACVIMDVFNKDLHVDGLTVDLVRSVFPNLGV